MWWVAQEYWVWLLVSAVLGAVVTSWGTVRRLQPVAEPEPVVEPTPEPEPVVEDGAFGPGSAAPLEAGSSPGEAFTVKVGAGSKLFHTEASPSFARTTAAHWFVSEEAATAAGFFRWDDPERPRRKKKPTTGSAG